MGRKTLWIASLLLATTLPMSVSIAGAANAVPAATLSDPYGSGGADLSDGVTPEFGAILGGFRYLGEAGTGTRTTVIDFTLPPGTTVISDPECAELGLNNLCLIFLYEPLCDWSTTDPAKRVTVSGNTLSFRMACDIEEYFEFGAYLTSLISTPGVYDMSVQFKTTTLKRNKSTANMWQVKLPGSFEVSEP
jgi:hypothetical protein